MPYKVKFSKIFLRKYGKLPKGIKSKTTEAIKEILVKPYGGIMLVGPLRGLWKLKIGKYRLLYEIDEKDRSIIFHEVELRKKVYK